jgi:hypothetical protein
MTFNGAHTQHKRFSDGTVALALQQEIEHSNFGRCELEVRH